MSEKSGVFVGATRATLMAAGKAQPLTPAV